MLAYAPCAPHTPCDHARLPRYGSPAQGSGTARHHSCRACLTTPVRTQIGRIQQEASEEAEDAIASRDDLESLRSEDTRSQATKGKPVSLYDTLVADRGVVVAKPRILTRDADDLADESKRYLCEEKIALPQPAYARTHVQAYGPLLMPRLVDSLMAEVRSASTLDEYWTAISAYVRRTPRRRSLLARSRVPLFRANPSVCANEGTVKPRTASTGLPEIRPQRRSCQTEPRPGRIWCGKTVSR